MRPNASSEAYAPRRLAAFAALACRRREQSPSGAFAFSDSTDGPWIEIDFAGGIGRADAEVQPRVPMAERNRHVATIIVRHGNRGRTQRP